MFSGNSNFRFSSGRDLRTAARYSLLMSAGLAALALIDCLLGQSTDAALILLVAVFAAIHAVVMTISERPWRFRRLHWWVVAVLVVMLLALMDDQMSSVFLLCWLPFYLAFALPWERMLPWLMLFCGLFLLRLWWAESLYVSQILLSFTLCVAIALLLARLQQRSQQLLAEFPGTDALTGAYLQSRLLHDLRREVPRADRQNTRLALALLTIPPFWRTLSPDLYGSQLQTLAARLAESCLPQQALYRLDSDDLVVLMPNFRPADAEQLRSRLQYCLAAADLPSDSLQVINYRADDDAASLLERLQVCASRTGMAAGESPL